jgi:hypothetical protein
MRARIVAVVAAGVLAVVGCAPESGEVVGRDYSPAWMSTTTQCTTSGRVQVCSPQVIHYPESWNLRLDDGQDTGWVSVTDDEYDRCHVGDHYPDCAQGVRR